MKACSSGPSTRRPYLLRPRPPGEIGSARPNARGGEMKRALSITLALAGAAALVMVAAFARPSVARTAPAKPSGCALSTGEDSRIKHGIYIQVGNTHYRRDSSSVRFD